jgi:hypothetical protein
MQIKIYIRHLAAQHLFYDNSSKIKEYEPISHWTITCEMQNNVHLFIPEASIYE